MPLKFSKTRRSPAAPPRHSKPVRRTRGASVGMPHLAARLLNSPLLIHRPKLDSLLSVLGPRLGLRADRLPMRAFDDDEMDDLLDPGSSTSENDESDPGD